MLDSMIGEMKSRAQILGRNLEKLLRLSGMSQMKLASLVKMTETSISKTVLGKSFPHNDNLEAIANALHVKVEDLLSKELDSDVQIRTEIKLAGLVHDLTKENAKLRRQVRNLKQRLKPRKVKK
jgi:transcriptional regulator with XRE-family HTH domain